MKSGTNRKAVFGATVAVVCGGLAAYVLGQWSAPAMPAGKLAEAVALLDANEPQQAREIIATITPTDPDYIPARYYDTLALHRLTNTPAFMAAMEALPSDGTAVPLEMKSELAFRHIQALFHYRRFEELLPKTQEFLREHAESEHHEAAAEYHLAGLIERGRKKAQEASILKDETQFQRRWTEAKANLAEFVSLASLFPHPNYRFLPQRVLQQDLWQARITLGEEAAALADIPFPDTASREQFSFLRTQIYKRLQPGQTDRNLALLNDFLTQYPASAHRARVEFDLAEFNFYKGRQLCQEAELAEQAGDSQTALEKRAAAGQHFHYVRSLQERIKVDKAAGIEASDVLDYRDDVLDTYCLERDYETVLRLSDSMAAEFVPGEVGWLIARAFNGIALFHLGRAPEASAVFDEVVAQGFRNKPAHDHWIIAAAKWRAYLAATAGDLRRTVELVDAVTAANCAKNLKDDFLKVYRPFAVATTD